MTWKPILKPVLREWLESPTSWRRRALDIFMAVLTVVSIASYVAYLSSLFPPEWDENIHTFDLAMVAVFALEYLARFHVASDFGADTRKKGVRAAIGAKLRFMVQPMSIIDLLALMPAVRVVRLARIFRLFRLLRLARHASSFTSIVDVVREHAYELMTVFGFMAAVLVMSGTAMFLVENPVDYPDTQFQTIGDAFWWAIVSMTTVGYGDKVPLTHAGRAIAGIVIVCGIFVIAFPTAIVTSAFMDKLSRMKEGRANMKQLEDHVVICGHSKATHLVVRELEAWHERFGLNREIVLVASFAGPDVRAPGESLLLKGDITRESVLREAGVERAAAIIVLAERRTADTPDETVDARTILAAMQADSLNPRALITVEIAESENVKTIRSRIPRAEVIETGALAPRLMALGTSLRGASELVSDLVSAGNNDLYSLEVSARVLEQSASFGGLFAPLREQGAIPVSIRRGAEVITNPGDTFALQAGDFVLAISRKQPHL